MVFPFLWFMLAVVIIVGFPLMWMSFRMRGKGPITPLVMVTVVHSDFEAKIMKDALDIAGIKAYFRSPISGFATYADPYAFPPHNNVDITYDPFGICIYVRVRDADKAARVLAGHPHESTTARRPHR